VVEAVTAAISHQLVLLALFGLSAKSFAHQLDEYLQATLVSIEPSEIRLDINLTPGVAIADKVIRLIDGNHDQVISTNEALAYAELLRRDLGAGLDGKKLKLELAASAFPEFSELGTGWGIIQIEYVLKCPSLTAGHHSLALKNRHLPSISAYLLNATQPAASSIQISAQKRNDTQSAGEIVFNFRPPPSAFGIRGSIASAGGLLCAAILSGVWRRNRCTGQPLKRNPAEA